MASALDDLSGVKYHNAVRVPDRGEAVRDDKGGPALHEGVHAFLHQALRIRDRGRFSVSPSTLKRPFPEGSEKYCLTLHPANANISEQRVHAIRGISPHIPIFL